MKTLLIEVPLRGNITPFELNRRICNRLEELEGRRIDYPELEHTSVPMVVNRVTSHSFFRKIINQVMP